MKLKLSKILVSFILLLGITFETVNAFAYNGWADEYLNFCKSKGIISGNAKGDLMPDDKLTKEQMAKILLNSFGVDIMIIEGNDYTDVDDNSWSYPYICEFSKFEINKKSKFYPKKNVTREEFMAMAMKIAGYENEEIKDNKNLKNNFVDYDLVDDCYRDLILIGYEKGFILGSNGYLKPDNELTRAEACSILYKILQNKAGNDNTQNVKETVIEQNIPKENEATVAVDPYADIEDIEILGKSSVTMEQAQKWAKARGATDLFIEAANYYWEFEGIFGIKAEVLYAQAAKETGFGRYGGNVVPEQNNFAGIKKYGATGDRGEDHETFATQKDGVRAHFNHMSAYVGVEPYGEVHGRYNSVKTLSWAGTIKTVKELSGKWCPNSGYGASIITDYILPMRNTK